MKLKQERDKYLSVSFLGGMFKHYFNETNKLNLETESMIKNEKVTFYSLINFYTYLMKIAIDTKK